MLLETLLILSVYMPSPTHQIKCDIQKQVSIVGLNHSLKIAWDLDGECEGNINLYTSLIENKESGCK